MKAFIECGLRVLAGAIFGCMATMLGTAAVTTVFVLAGSISQFAYKGDLTIGAVLGALAGGTVWGRCVRPGRALIGTAILFALLYLLPLVRAFVNRITEPPTVGEIIPLIALLVLEVCLGAGIGFLVARVLVVVQCRTTWFGSPADTTTAVKRGMTT